MIEGEDYNFIYDYDDKNVGEHVINVEAVPEGPTSQKYLFTTIGSTLTILQKQASISLVDNSSTYGDDFPTIDTEQSGFLDGEELIETIDYDVIVTDKKNVGSHNMTIALKDTKKVNNYDITTTGAIYTINKKAIDLYAENKRSMKTYERPLTVRTGHDDDMEYKEILRSPNDYTLYRDSGTEEGDYTIHLEINENGDIAKNYDITPHNGTYTIISNLVVIELEEVQATYGDAIPSTFKFNVHGFPVGVYLKPDEYSVSCTATDSSPVGKYDIIIELNESCYERHPLYTFDVDTGKDKFIINRKNATATCDTKEITYGEPDVPLTITQDEGFLPDDTLSENDYRIYCTKGDNHNVGEYNIAAVKTIDGPVSKNYNITFNIGKYIIKQAEGLTLTANAASKIYGELDPAFSCEISGAKFDDDEKITEDDYSFNRTKGEVAGEYPLNFSVETSHQVFDNYKNIKIVDAELVISKFSDMDKVEIEDIPEQIYTGKEICPEMKIYYVFDYGKTTLTKYFELGTDYSVEYLNSNVDAGTVQMKITGIGSCEGDAYSTFVIKQKDASLICNDVNVTYGDKEAELTACANGLVNSESLTKDDYSIERDDGDSAGIYVITATIKENGPIAKNYN